MEQRLLGKSAHIDTTSFSFEANYAEDPNGGEAVSICHGFSKDQLSLWEKTANESCLNRKGGRVNELLASLRPSFLCGAP